MPERLFLFIQMEFPWALGPPDGRYLLRDGRDEEPQHVVVLGTVGARRATRGRRAGAGRGPGRAFSHRGSRKGVKATSEPAHVAIARATIVDPVSVSAERQAQAWLSDLDAHRDVQVAVGALNRLLHSHRIASADPYVHEVSGAQALVVRAGWGEGEQVADGNWLHARELAPGSGPTRDGMEGDDAGGQTAQLPLRPEERLAELLGGWGESLVCEDLALRARLDLDQGRLALAAVELDRAYAAALPELRGEGRQDLALRIAELAQLRAGVAMQALAAMPGSTRAPEEEAVRHALERLEAALRARTASGWRA